MTTASEKRRLELELIKVQEFFLPIIDDDKATASPLSDQFYRTVTSDAVTSLHSVGVENEDNSALDDLARCFDRVAFREVWCFGRYGRYRIVSPKSNIPATIVSQCSGFRQLVDEVRYVNSVAFLVSATGFLYQIRQHRDFGTFGGYALRYSYFHGKMFATAEVFARPFGELRQLPN